MEDHRQELIDAGNRVEADRQRLADAVIKQDERMDSLEKKSRLSRATYEAISLAAKKIQINSEQLRADVDDLLERVSVLERYVEE